MIKGLFSRVLAGMFILMTNCSTSHRRMATTNDHQRNELTDILKQYPHYFATILQQKDDFKIQIIYTQIDREKNGNPVFTDHYFNVNKDNYYYPASTVKLPVAVLALQKLNELNIAGLDRNTTMITEASEDGQTAVDADSSAPGNKPCIAQYIKKILLVSDNDAFNRLYEFLGQEYINNTLHRMGYEEVQIIHRLSISLTEEQNRHTNPVKFYDKTGKLVYEKPAEKSRLAYAPRHTKLGKGYVNDDKIIHEPFDFSKKNRMSLPDLHNMVRSIMFPRTIPAKQRFNLTKEDYDFLHRYMSMMPQESKSPSYDTTNYHDTYVKFLLYGSERGSAEPHIRLFNKVGDAYGFLIDGAYIVDFKNNIEFLLSAVIYCNSDGIFNDDQYDYDSVGFPFMKHLGRAVYDHELKRKRHYRPDLSALPFHYQEQ